MTARTTPSRQPSRADAGIDDALVMFVDIRGFTRFAEKNEIFANLQDFVSGFLDLLSESFPSGENFFKPLGDGALIVRPAGAVSPTRQLASLLKLIERVNRRFEHHCRTFAKRVGEDTQLELGWGVVRGKVKRVGNDYASHNLNKCARLCAVARPFGVVVDMDDFPELPKKTVMMPKVFRLDGIGDVRAWVTPEIATTFLPRERLRETPEVHVAGLAVAGDAPENLQVLIARRSNNRRLFPGKFEGCGGQLSAGESFTDGVRRHYRKELGLEVQPVADLHCLYEIREPDTPVIPGLRFLCKVYDQPSEVTSERHSEVRWVTEQQLRRVASDEFVGNLKDEALDLLAEYKKTLRRRSHPTRRRPS
jgi:class 3 adenylate cyclase/isopentenyldiphosphate isomerase